MSGWSPTAPYLDHLQHLGVDARPDGVWLKVDRSTRVQGWKLHISSVPVQAHALIDALVPLLQARQTPFKIARDATVLGLLNEGSLGGTQIGKFCTIYPPTDDDAAALARDLLGVTAGFEGPRITSDLPLGGVVHARYGGFNPIVQRDLLGQHQLFILDEQGRPVPDTYSQPFVAPAFARNPFATDSPSSATGPAGTPQPVRSAPLGPGYVVVDVLQRHAKGDVLLAIDVRSQAQVAGRVLKQGRPHCLSDVHGRDIRDRLRRQGRIHRELQGSTHVPLADECFEVEGDVYLPLAFVPGADLETFVQATLQRRPWHQVEPEGQRRLLRALQGMVETLTAVHRAGYVHRDLSVSNVWLGDDGHTHLLDLEIAQHIGDPQPLFGKGTPGFMAPEQEAGAAASFAQDVHAACALALFAFTGLDPRRTLFAQGASRQRNLTHLAQGVPPKLLALLLDGVSRDPLARPALSEVGAALAACTQAHEASDAQPGGTWRGPSVGPAPRHPVHPKRPQDWAIGAARGLLTQTFRNEAGLWLSAGLSQEGAPGSRTITSYELRRGANRGVSGVVYVLARLARSGVLSPASHPTLERSVHQAVQGAAQWLLSDAPAPDLGMGGLHFGDAGVAVALAEAVAAGQLQRSPALDDWVMSVLCRTPLVWPDLTHGAAGVGLGALMCADLLDLAELNTVAARCAAHLLETQAADGSWRMPEGVPGMSGETLTGFAHGVAGMAYFLLEWGARAGDAACLEGAQRGLRWLAGQAFEPDGAASSSGPGTPGLRWRYSDRQAAVWSWWCHGAPGIALAFLQAHRVWPTAETERLARGALAGIDARLRAPNLSVCHGLSGLGEVLLEAADALNDPAFEVQAHTVADTLMHLAHQDPDGGRVWLTEDPVTPTADLMVGMGGIAHFFLRLGSPRGALGFPLLPRHAGRLSRGPVAHSAGLGA